MSIIVTGMKMPKFCVECPMYNGEFVECNLIQTDAWDFGADPFEERHKDCPLREVKE